MMKWLANKFELSRGGKASNLASMEGLRGLAVFLVFLVHYVSLIDPWIADDALVWKVATGLRTMGNCGVDLFFVLSGYLIYGSLIVKEQPFLRYMTRRIQRIYPTFTVVFLIYVALNYARAGESRIPEGFVEASRYLLTNYLLLPGMVVIEPMITVAWSLSFEMFYYLAVPLLIAVLALRRRPPSWRLLFFVILSVLTTFVFRSDGWHIKLIMFLSGILLYEVMHAAFRAPRLPGIVGVLALGLGLAGTLLSLDGTAGNVVKMVNLFLMFGVLCLACFAHPEGWLARLFSWTPLRWLGNMSYSYYLLHGLALHVAFMVFAKVVPAAPHGAAFFWGLLPIMFAATLPPTAALFHFVERPFSLSKSSRPQQEAEVTLARGRSTAE